MKRNCNDLGVCQSRTPACPGCGGRHPFAPGVIEHHRRRGVIRAIATWLRRLKGRRHG